MKIIFSFLLAILSTNGFCQTYVLDNSFATDGRQYFPGNSFEPKNGILLNDNYYIISSDKVIKMDYNGAISNSFGLNGALSPLPFPNYSMMKITSYNNHLYLSGCVIVSNAVTDFFVCKIDEDGNPDNTFGSNGVVTVDFGANELISDFIIEPSGKLFCVGERRVPNAVNSSRMIYFKINTDGTIDNTFDPNGFKSISYNLETIGTFITTYEDGYLLVGNSLATSGDLNRPLLLVKVDSNGNLMSDFGISGIKSKPIQNLSILNWTENHVLYNNKLYLNGLYTMGFVGQPGSLLIYDLGTDEVNYHHRDYGTTHFDVFDDGVFLTGYWKFCGGNSVYQCQSKFNLSKKHFDGTTDTNFQNNSVYEYEFPNNIDTNNQSCFFIRDNSGKFLIVAYSNMYSNLSVETEGLSMIRIKEGVLDVSNPVDKSTVSIYPNPFEDKVIIDSDESIIKLELFDLSGRKFSEPRFAQKNGGIVDLSHLEASTYFLKIWFEDGSIITKKMMRK